MVRAAAKNHPRLLFVVSPQRYGSVIEAVKTGFTSTSARRWQPRHSVTPQVTTSPLHPGWARLSLPMPTAASSRMGRRGLGAGRDTSVRREPASALQRFTSRQTLRLESLRLTNCTAKEMSYNNYVDADAAYRAAYDFTDPAVAIIKHANPCGLATGSTIADAHRKAHETGSSVCFRWGDRNESRSRRTWRAGCRGVHWR